MRTQKARSTDQRCNITTPFEIDRTRTCSDSCNEQNCKESACIDFHIVLLYLDISMVCRYLIVIFYETMQLQSQVMNASLDEV